MNAPLAFVFPGQGSQRVGMGAELKESGDAALAALWARAEEITRAPIGRLCIEGPLDELTRTDVAQPAIFSVSLALVDAAARLGIRPAYVAGHSLGEYTAAVVAGVLDPADGLALVCERGRLMAEVQAVRPGAMAAVIGLTVTDVERLCTEASDAGAVSIANHNSPTQVVVSGEVAAVDRLVALATAGGAEQAIRLNVGAAFHSALMDGVRDRLAGRFAEVTWRDPEVPLVANVSGTVLRTSAEVRAALLGQITGVVRWADCVTTLIASGCRFLEVGPGRVLSGLARQIDPDVDASSADSPQKLARFAERSAAGT